MEDKILLIDKPAGWTSFDVVAKVRGRVRAGYAAKGVKPTKRQLKVGHAGTLDPFATGLLIILLGGATKRATEFLKLDKSYRSKVRLGATSSTGDPEGEITATATEKLTTPQKLSFQGPSLEDVGQVLESFVGEITQVPPAHSAIKIDGQRAYRLARQGVEFAVPSRQVTVHEIRLVSYSYPELVIEAHVSSGTYIRTLAEDIGEALGVGAYCQELRRLTVGEWSIADAKSVDEVTC